MSDLAVNQLKVVQTYQMSGLAVMQNMNCFIDTSNHKFRGFDRFAANLGDTVTYDLPPRFVAGNSLIASFQPAAQRSLNLSVNMEGSVPFEFSAQQFIFQAEQYMERFGASAVAELGARIEQDVASVCETSTYRFFGSPLLPINSYGTLANMLAQYRNYGSVPGRVKVYLSDLAVPSIVNSGLNQFVPVRNEKTAYSWEVGSYDNADFYRSSKLPIHIAGTVGTDAIELSVDTVVPNAAGAIDTIVFNTTPTLGVDTNAIKKYDRLVFTDPTFKFLQFVGHQVSGNAVQLLALEDAASNGDGKITIKFMPALQVATGAEMNINKPVVPGMIVSVLNSHKVGVVIGGDSLFLAMPQLPSMDPFPSSSAYDASTGASFRQYYGVTPFLNKMGMCYDCIWGKSLVPENCMAIIFPLNQ